MVCAPYGFIGLSIIEVTVVSTELKALNIIS